MKINNLKQKLFLMLLFLVVAFFALNNGKECLGSFYKDFLPSNNSNNTNESIWGKITKYISKAPGLAYILNNIQGTQADIPIKEYSLTLGASLTERRAADIILPKNATAVEKDVREKLVVYVRSISGVTLPTYYEDDQGKTASTNTIQIHVGKTSRWNNYSADFSKINDSGILIRFTDDTAIGKSYIHIGGKTDAGIQNAGYYFIERYLGVHKYLPGNDGIYIPTSEIVVVQARDKTENPAYENRVMSGITDSTWKTWNLASGGGISMSHNLYNLVDFAYGDPTSPNYRPDFFPVINETRIIPKIETKADGTKALAAPNSWQPVLTNQDLRNAMVQKILNLYPTTPNISLGINDTGSFDEKNDIAKYYSSPPSSTGKTKAAYDAAYAAYMAGLKEKYHNTNGYLHLSDLVFDALNDIVGQVTSRTGFENRIFGTLAYQWTEDAPWTKSWNLQPQKVLNPQIMPYVTYDRSMWRDTNLKNKNQNLIREWIPKAKQIGIYDYLYGATYVIPRFTPHLIGESLRFHADLKKEDGSQFVKGFYGEAYPNWGLDGLKLFVVSKFLWNTSEWDFKYYSSSGEMVDAIMNEFYQNFFQEAKDPMKAYFDELENAWMNMTPEQNALFQAGATNNTIHRWFFPRELDQLSIFPPERITFLKSRLDEAATLAKSDLVKRRIALFRTAFDHLALCSDLYHKRKILDDPSHLSDSASLEATLNAMENFVSTKERRRLYYRSKINTDPVLKSSLGYTLFDNPSMDIHIEYLFSNPFIKATGVILGYVQKTGNKDTLARLAAIRANELAKLTAIENEYKSAGITGYESDLTRARTQLQNFDEQVQYLNAYSSSANKLVNGEFEGASNPPGSYYLDANNRWATWKSNSPGIVFSMSSDNPFSGNKMLRIEKATGGAAVSQLMRGVTAGQTYQVSGFIRVKASTKNTYAAIGVRFYKADLTTTIGSDKILSYPYMLDGEWFYTGLRFTVPEGAAYVHISAQAAKQNPDGSEKADFDNISLSQITENSPAANIAPTAIISSITPSSSILTTSTVTFTGKGADTDGTISGYNWRLDSSEVLGTTDVVTKTGLTAGTHIVYFKVKDDDGAWSNEVSQQIVVTAPAPTNTTPTTNIVLNGGFENAAILNSGSVDSSKNWWKWHDNSPNIIISISNDIPFSGKQILRIEKATGGSAVYQFVSVPAGHSYQLSGYIRVKSPTAKTYAAIGVRFYKSDMTTIVGNDQVLRYPTGLDGMWSQVNLRFTVPAGAAYVHISAQAAYQNSDGSDKADFDGLSLSPVSETSTPTPTPTPTPANIAPTAIISSITPTGSILTTSTVTFTGLGADTDGTISEYSWRLDANEILGTSTTVTKSGLSAGTHTVYFKVKDDDGAWSTEVSKQIVVSEPVVTSPSPSVNIIMNGGFEDTAILNAGSIDSTRNWWKWYTNSPSIVISVSNDTPFSGKQILRIEKATGGAAVYQLAGVRVGQTYQMSGYIRVKSPTASTYAAIGVRFVKSDMITIVGTDQILRYPNGLDNVWSQVNLRFTVPDGVAYVHISAQVMGQKSDGSEKADFDNVSCSLVAN
jgi:hypothetical protein